MNALDRFCAFLAALLGIVLLILGGIGLFFGCGANFTLPPVLGVVPAFIGWGILRSVYVGLKYSPRPEWLLDSPEEPMQQ